MEKLQVGQVVYLRDGRGNTSEHTVVRVGRKNAYVERYGRECGFDMETGIAVGDVRGYPERYRTAAQLADDDRRSALGAELKELGVAPSRYGGWRISTDKMAAIVAILREGD